MHLDFVAETFSCAGVRKVKDARGGVVFWVDPRERSLKALATTEVWVFKQASDDSRQKRGVVETVTESQRVGVRALYFVGARRHAHQTSGIA